MDLGAGTGRLACELAPEAEFVIALDQSSAVLEVTAERLEKPGLDNWQVQAADCRNLPVRDG
ncbi:MAG: class I SAM-dependent methyltransferase [Thermoactinomyces sp.]